jgi:hypothetical protein
MLGFSIVKKCLSNDLANVTSGSLAEDNCVEKLLGVKVKATFRGLVGAHKSRFTLRPPSIG